MKPIKVLIVAKTRRGSGACIGAISESGRSLRLDPPDLDSEGVYNQEYEVGDVWELRSYEFPSETVAPHVENVIVRVKRRLARNWNCIPAILKHMPPLEGGIDFLYDGLTQGTPGGVLYISEENGVPSYSTMFWRPDRPLRLDHSGKRLRYCYPKPNGDAKLTYVGFPDPLPEIPAGALVRVSLAHWWRPDDADDNMELRCHCQLSGWFLHEQENASHGDNRDSKRPACEDPDINVLLRTVFGFEEFREPQEEIIRGLLDGKDALAIMPTGGGKSLCYQLAAIALKGVAVVVSPLIALMQDQVDALHALGIPATFLNSTLNYTAFVERQRLVRNNQVRLLYVAPETLARPETIYLLQNSNMTLLAIDEAHCISEWGHDFRPEYRQLGDIRRKLPSAPCIALTATATPRVQHDIVDNLEIKRERIYVGDLDRSNLFLEVRHRSSDPIAQVASFIDAHKDESGIVYCATRAGVDELCAALAACGVSALPYHAGLDDDVRLDNQTRFVRDDVNVMVATVAFGMGIDKSNIRYVVHYNLPDCLDKYYQQIGRAGRDGLRADCLLLHAPEDIRTRKFLISKMAPRERHGAYHRLDQMHKWITSRSCRRIVLLHYFGQNDTSGECAMCDRCVDVAPYETDLVDLSEYAKQFLQCVKQCREGFGKTHIIDVLRGSRSQKVRSWNHDRLSTYGTGRGLSAKLWRNLADQFMERGLVHAGAMHTLHVTERGQRVLGGKPFAGRDPHSGCVTSKVGRPETRGELKYDAALFEKLRSLRKSIADEANLPPFAVFHDSSLREMAAFCPTTIDEFRDIRGVGQAKSSNYGAQFLAAIREHCADPTAERTQITQTLHDGSEVDAPELRPRTRQVVACYLETKSLRDASEQLDISPVTVVGHLERYVQAGYELPLEPIIAESAVPAARCAQIFEMFAESDSDALKPIFEHFDGAISYLQLRILLLWYHLTAQEQQVAARCPDPPF